MILSQYDPFSMTDNSKEFASVSMHTGKLVRLNRLFSHPSGRLCSVAVDHFIGYPEGLPAGLRHIARALQAIAAGRPDAVTMHKGVAAAAWAPYAGAIPMILQSTIARVDDTACEQIATPGDAVRLGADAFAVAAFVCGDSEAGHLRTVAEAVRSAARYEMPVISHIYPRDFRAGKPVVSYEPEDIAWAVRCAVECGVDVVKVPYCGNVAAYAEIVADCPVPVVAAGGPRTKTLEAALRMMADVVASGARGATIGRNVWSSEDITATVRAFKAVIHDGKMPQQALFENDLALPAPA
jgi:class I fructose-bisphosphate aldolase